jgi:hypothetical protein
MLDVRWRIASATSRSGAGYCVSRRLNFRTSTRLSTDVAGLLDPLSERQQRLVELVANAFVDDKEWPVFDYLEGTFDQTRDDAGEILASLPRSGRWNYGCAWWIGLGQAPKPASAHFVELTALGMHHSQQLRRVVGLFFDVIALMVRRRQTTPLSRRSPRALVITNDDVESLISSERVVSTDLWSLAIYKLLEREPLLTEGGGFHPDGLWSQNVSRNVYEYEGVKSIEEYVERVERLTALPLAPVIPATPSPLDLALALDYLDTVWRVTFRTPLFKYPGGERTTKLAFPANTAEEFESRLSALGEILRSANTSAKSKAGSKLARATHDDPLAPLEDHVVANLDSAGEARVRNAVTELEHAIAIRDAAQHVEAGGRAVRALDAFNIAYPIPSFSEAWQTVTAHVVEALSAIREELASTS